MVEEINKQRANPEFSYTNYDYYYFIILPFCYC